MRRTEVGVVESMTFSADQLALLNALRDYIGANATAKGFRDKFSEGLTQEQWEGSVGDLIRAAVYTANQHAESSEFWESYRKGTLYEPCDKSPKMIEAGIEPLTCGEEEIADEIIRALDKAEIYGIDVAKAVSSKMAFNATRSKLHGGKQA